MENFIELIWTFLVNHEKNWGVINHKHDHYQMYCCLSGCGKVLLDNQTFILKENSCLLIRPQQIHELSPIESGHFRIIDTTFYVHDKAIESAIYLAPQYYPVMELRFRDLQKSMQNEWDSNALYSKEMAELLFNQAILLLLRSTSPMISPASDTSLSENEGLFRSYQSLKNLPQNTSGTEKIITDYLRAHFLEELTLDKISKDLHYSKNYICKTFTHTSGYTIKQYINYLRINKSYDLVCHTDSRFSEIAAQCGFSSIHYFSRTFHRIVGITPSQARARFASADLRLYGPRQYRYLSNDGTAKKNPK